jgi:1,2-diacylglycerol 3-beta-glucosyltransferase
MVTAATPVRGRRRAVRPASHRRLLLAYAGVVAGTVALFGADRTLGWTATALDVVFLLFLLRHLVFAVAAARWAERDVAAPTVGTESFTPPVAVLMACRDEELAIDGMITALLALDYPPEAMTVVVVDDASTDGTGARLDAWAHADPRLRVLHRARDAGGGRPGALNDALTMVDADVAVVIDSDRVPERTLLRRLVRHFRDPNVGAVTGRVVRDGAGSSPAAALLVDPVAGHLVEEYGRQALFELPAYGGANCAVRVDLLRSLGGWNRHTVIEDTDLTLRVLLAGWRVRFDPSAVDAEEPASSARRVIRQRYRWARGHQQVLRDHWKPLLLSRHLSPAQKVETMLFLGARHVPVLCGLALVLIALRASGIGGASALGLVPLVALVCVPPFTELAVGLLHGRTERRAAWTLAGVVPSFGVSVLAATSAYVDGMWGRPYSWWAVARPRVTARQANAVLHPVAPSAPNADSLSFARREAIALSMMNARIGSAPPGEFPGQGHVQQRSEVVSP